MLLCSSVAMLANAQANAPKLFPKPSIGGCTLIDNGNQVVLEVWINGLTSFYSQAALFSIDATGFLGSVVSVEYPPGIIGVGDPTNGIQVEWPCGPVFQKLVSITYQTFGLSSACGTINVGPIPGQSSILVADCNWDTFPTTSIGPITVNPTAACNGNWCVLATEPTSWGRVKALYR
jgi:hypothetical protein